MEITHSSEMDGNRDEGSTLKAQTLQRQSRGDNLIPTEGMMVFSPTSHGGAVQDAGPPARLPYGQLALPTLAKAQGGLYISQAPHFSKP